MGRHATTTTTTRRGWPPPPLVLIAALAVVALVAGGLVWWLAGSDDDGNAAACGDDAAVRVAVAPEIAPVVQEVLADALSGDCVTADVVEADSLQTVAALTAGADSGVPDVWVPDSSIWPAQVEGASVEQAGTLAISPLVLATSRASAEDLGVLAPTPVWLDVVIAALTAGRSMPTADLTGSARQIGVSLSVEATGNGVAISDEELAASLGLSRSGATLDEVRSASVAGNADAGLWAGTEQDVLASYLAGDSQMVALYPEGGSTYLDYPVVRAGEPDGDRRAAVDTVVAALTSDDAAAAVRAAGFRDADGNAPDGAGPDTGTQPEAPERLPMEPDAATAAIEQANRVLAPSRLLTVIDTSTSMEATAAGGTRISLAVDAARTALAGLPDEYSVGLWTFAYRVDGDRDYAERVPLRALDADVDGSTQRAALAAQLQTLSGSLTSGGTGLYDTALAAVRAARELYQEGAVSSVVLLTDGTNDDDAGGISLQGLIDTLRSEADPDRPVQLVGVALGPEADLEELQQIAAATGGTAYSAQDPDDLQAVLFDAIRER
ncbi:substrate-binding domain-containing protein [Trujillonella endophytica]|uniref:von Willebrand factor type A domain-containing protein n=1 Tax=Trujillonella endophytica TaxID=673521 RepID=A0A1H8W1Z9_9ACTN|nr:substrate-binding domain-containing protein [Trujillella endophytica]SEP21666.1 von Willebrand factor type A domain-containing protein [Trujillella endophytica]